MKKGFRLLTIFLLIIASLVSPPLVSADNTINVIIDGKLQNYDQPPVAENGRTLVPLRGIFESLGASVNWDNNTQSITASKDDTTIYLTVGEPNAMVNDSLITLDVASKVVNNRTLVPLRFVSESLGANVEWEQETKTIYITKNKSNITNNESNHEANMDDHLTAEEIVKENDHKVVKIEAYSNVTNFGSQGSGFFIKENLILTNYHVVEGTNSAVIFTSTGEVYDVEGIVSYNPTVDLAVLKTKQNLNISPVKLKSALNINKGQEVFAIGSPDGYQNTISNGIISGKRVMNNVGYIQHTAPITHGSSGGPLFNAKGEVIGINTLTAGEANLNFAVPIDYIQDWLDSELNDDSFNATFPAIEDTSNDNINYKLQSLETALSENIRTIPTTKGNINLSEWNVSFFEDGTISIFTNIDPNQYGLYLQNYDILKPQVMEWARSIGITLDEMLPNDTVMLGVYYQDIYDFYPDSFAPEEISLTANNYWLVTHRIIEIFLDDNDNIRWNVRF